MIKQIDKHRYRFIVSIGSGKAQRKVSKTITFNGGKKALKKLYDEYEEEVKSQSPSSDITVEQLLDNYIESCKVLGRKPVTIRGYRICLNRISDSLKRQKAKDCTTYHIEKEIARMSRESFSAKTIKNSIGLLSAAYRHAIRTKQLTENPCEYATLPKEQKSEKRILYMDEIQPFLNGIADAPLDEKVAYELALFLGLRRSEILGIKESDVDILNGMIYIHNTRHRVDGVDYDSDTKTEQSTRVLALPDILIMDIARLLESHRQFPYEKVDYLIQDGFGNIILPQTLAARLTRLEEKKKLPHVTLHGLRHTYASLLNSAGVDMAWISKNLGHSNLSTTANIYTHVFKNPTKSSRGIAEVINTLKIE